MSLIEDHRPSPWLGVLLGTTACLSGAALYDRCDGCNAHAETTMLIRVTDLQPEWVENELHITCPHCHKEGLTERAQISLGEHPDLFGKPQAAWKAMATLTLEGIIQAEHGSFVIREGIVGTIVPLQGNANIRGSAFLGL